MAWSHTLCQLPDSPCIVPSDFDFHMFCTRTITQCASKVEGVSDVTVVSSNSFAEEEFLCTAPIITQCGALQLQLLLHAKLQKIVNLAHKPAPCVVRFVQPLLAARLNFEHGHSLILRFSLTQT